MECTRCGACCVAPDIAALDKPVGVRCPHLGPDLLCTIYERRPAICRSYAADWLCEEIAAPTLDERVGNYHRIFRIVDEADEVRRRGVRSMREARGCTRG